MARGAIAEAEVELAEIRRLGAVDKNRQARLFGEYEISSLLQIAAEVLDGQIKLKSQKTDDGIAARWHCRPSARGET